MKNKVFESLAAGFFSALVFLVALLAGLGIGFVVMKISQFSRVLVFTLLFFGVVVVNAFVHYKRTK